MFKYIKTNETKIPVNDWIQRCNKIHKNKYDYSKVEYINKDNKVIIICPIHGDFEQRAGAHIRGANCQDCAHKSRSVSKIAITWLEYIKITIPHLQYISNFEGEFRIPGTRYHADGYDEKTNTVYEYHGDFWHGNPKIHDPEDMNPVTKCSYGKLYEETLHRKLIIKKLGYNYKYIWDSDWKRGIAAIIKIQRLYKYKK